MNKIVIVVSGGIIRNILADEQDYSVEIIDFDNVEDDISEDYLRDRLSQAENELNYIY
jgi:hypothetical protein